MNKKNSFKKMTKLSSALIAINLLLLSCTSPTYLDARDKTIETVRLTNDLLKPAHVVVTDEAFIDAHPIFQKYHPDWVKRQLTITINQESTLDELLIMLFKNNSKIKVVMDEALIKNMPNLKIAPKTLNGTLVDLVDKICAELDVHYSIDGYQLSLSELETKILQIGILPGSSSYEMGKSSGTVGSTASGAGSLNNGSVRYTSDTKVAQWDNLEDILNTYTSKPNGIVKVNQSSSTVTIIDRPSVVKKIEDFINKYNKINMQQVGIKIQVLEVTLNEGYKRGIDWDLIRESLNTDLNINFDFTNPTNILGAISGSNLGTIDWNIIDGKYNGSGFLVQYIEEQGNVSIVSEPRFTILNNQVSELSILAEEGYVKTRTFNPGNVVTAQSVGLNPGTLLTGFRLYILPTIIEDEILLQITTSISRKVQVDNFGDDGDGNALLQLPKLNDRVFIQRSIVPNNSTLVLTGFKEQAAGTSDASPFKMNLAGGQTAAKNTTEIVILVTPVIIRG